MDILVADDDPISRHLLKGVLGKDGHRVLAVDNGERAWQILQQPDAPRLVVLNGLMPGKDGAELCRLLRAEQAATPSYVILLSARDARADIVAGLQSGANDYVTKPFDPAELKARVHVGENVLELQLRLAEKVVQLEHALAEIGQLRRLLPICSYCKKIRDDGNYWQQIDKYFTEHAHLRFSHGICPECWRSFVAPQLESIRKPPLSEG